MSEKHILLEAGILSEFTIARKLPDASVKKIKEKAKRKIRDGIKIEQGDIVTDSFRKDTDKMLKKTPIPGVPSTNSSSRETKSLMAEEKRLHKKYDIYLQACLLFAGKLRARKIDKFFLCFIINTLIALFELTEEDFTDFTDKYEKDIDGNSDSSEE